MIFCKTLTAPSRKYLRGAQKRVGRGEGTAAGKMACDGVFASKSGVFDGIPPAKSVKFSSRVPKVTLIEGGEGLRKTTLREPVPLARFQFSMNLALPPRHRAFGEAFDSARGQVSVAHAPSAYDDGQASWIDVLFVRTAGCSRLFWG